MEDNVSNSPITPQPCLCLEVTGHNRWSWLVTKLTSLQSFHSVLICAMGLKLRSHGSSFGHRVGAEVGAEHLGTRPFALRFPPVDLKASGPPAPLCFVQSLSLSFFFFFFVFSRAAPSAYGDSQARGLRHSHSNMGSKPQLQPAPQLTVTPDP